MLEYATRKKKFVLVHIFQKLCVYHILLKHLSSSNTLLYALIFTLFISDMFLNHYIVKPHSFRLMLKVLFWMNITELTSVLITDIEPFLNLSYKWHCNKNPRVTPCESEKEPYFIKSKMLPNFRDIKVCIKMHIYKNKCMS